MAFLDKSKANYAFKALLGKAHTSNGRELSNEAIPSGIILSAARIFADSINSNPSDPSNTGIVSAQVTLVLEAIAGSDTFTLGEYQGYRAKLGGTVPASLAGITNPVTGAPYAPNDYVGNIIPQSFGDNFRPILYSDAAATIEIPPSSAADWFIDCYAGIVVQEGSEDGGTPFILGSNGRLKAYIYTGRFVKDALTSGGGGGGSGSSEWLDSAKGFSQDLIGGTNAFFNFYDDTALSNHIDQSLLVNGLRWIHIGSTVSGLNIYNPTTNTFSTGSISNNDVVQYYVSMGTSGTIGYIKTTPTLGTNIVFDSDETTIFRFTGTTWIPTSVTASNGLTKTGNNIALGGSLTSDINIDSSVLNTSSVYFGANSELANFKVWSGNISLRDPNTGAGFNVDVADQVSMYADDTRILQIISGNQGIQMQTQGTGDITINPIADLIVSSNNFVVAANSPATFQGIKYQSDYSANYTNRSLVDKQYVLNKIYEAGTAGAVLSGSGITIANNQANLGGALNQDATVTGSAFNVAFGDPSGIQSFNVNTVQNTSIYSQNGNVDLTAGSGTAGSGTVQLAANGSGFVEIVLNTGANQFLINDGRSGANQSGIQYASDYTANYTNLSLVHKGYVDSIAAGLDPKAACRVATTTYITLSGLQTIDGVTLVDGDRVLVKDQGTAGQFNGIYNAHSGAWTRASDFDGTPSNEVSSGDFTFIQEGTVNKSTGWVLATPNPITLGVTSLTFVQFSAAGVITASNGLTQTGENITLGGALTQNTTITGAAFDFSVNTKGVILTENGDGITLQDNNGGGITLNETGGGTYITGTNGGITMYETAGGGIAIGKPSVYNSGGIAIADRGGVSLSGHDSGGTNRISLDLDGQLDRMLVDGQSISQAIFQNLTNFSVAATTITLVDTLNSSTAGYDIMVRNSTTGVIEKISSSVLTGSVPTTADKVLIPAAGTNGTSGNANPTGLTITNTPSAHGYVEVTINGIQAQLGTSSSNGDCYFAQPGSFGSIGRALNAIQAGDEFFWNAANAGFYLDMNDVVDFLYSV